MKLVCAIVLLVVGLCAAKKEATTCDTMFCAMGQECVMRGGQATCECVEECREPIAPVCGRNGDIKKTYKNKCEFFKEMCEVKERETIELVSTRSCEDDEMEKYKKSEEIERDSTKEKPVVCVAKDRDALRKAIMMWFASNLEGDHRSYEGLLFTYFNQHDVNKDEMLDVNEFIEIVKENEIFSEVSKMEDTKKFQCFGELVALSDDDSNYMLTFEEFHKCFDPEFQPPRQKCNLEGREYEDGEDAEKDCNTCKCACGNWVCTQHDCTENSSKAKLLKEMSRSQ